MGRMPMPRARREVAILHRETGQSQFHGEDVLGKGNVVRAAKIGAVPCERLRPPATLPGMPTFSRVAFLRSR
jgi:hypothetical protein